jgi:hypothetical protein
LFSLALAGKDMKKRGQMQTLFAICRAGVSEEQPKIRKSLASKGFMVARSARSLRALALLSSLFPLFSQYDPAGLRPAMCGHLQIIMVARNAQLSPPCQKSGRGTGGGCAVEKRGRELVRVAL